MTYNLRPRRASLVPRLAAGANLCCVKQDATKGKRAGLHVEQERHRCSPAGAPRQADPSPRARESLPNPNVLTDEAALRRTCSAPSSEGDEGNTSPEPAVTAGIRLSCERHGRCKQRSRIHARRDKTYTQTVRDRKECAAFSEAEIRLNDVCATSHHGEKCTPPFADRGHELAVACPRRKSPTATETPFVEEGLRTTSSCRMVLLPASVGTRLTGEPACDSAVACQREQGQAPYLPAAEHHRQPHTALSRPHLRVHDSVPQTPACSKGSMDACTKKVAQSECPSSDLKYSATASQHRGGNIMTQALSFLSPSTVTTPSPHRAGKRKRGHSRIGGASLKERGLSPQSPSHRARPVASTEPWPSRLEFPSSAVPVVPPAIPAREQGDATAAVSQNIRSLPSPTLQFNQPLSAPGTSAPGAQVPATPLLPPKEKHFENAFHQHSPPTIRSQWQVEARTSKHSHSRALASAGRGEQCAAGNLPRCKSQVPDSASTATLGTSSKIARRAPSVRYSELDHTKAGTSVSYSATAQGDVYSRPSGQRCKARRKSSQVRVPSQQVEDTSSGKKTPPSTLSSDQPAESYMKIRTNEQVSKRTSDAHRVATCDDRTQAACREVHGLLEDRECVQLDGSVHRQQSGGTAEEHIATHPVASQCCSAVRSSAVLQGQVMGSDHLTAKASTSQARVPTSYRLPWSVDPCATHPCGTAVGNGCTPTDETVLSQTTERLTASTFQVLPSQRSVLTRALNIPSTGHTCRVACTWSSSSGCAGFSGNSALFRYLPPVILCRILRLLPPSSLAAFGATCTYARELLRLPSSWKYLDERSTGKWMKYAEKLAKQASTHLCTRDIAAGPSALAAPQNFNNRNTWNEAAAAAPFACLSRISVDLTCIRGLNQTRSVSHALFDLPAVAVLRIAPAQRVRSGITHVGAPREDNGFRRTAQGLSAPPADIISLPVGGRASPLSSRGFPVLQYISAALPGTASAVEVAVRSGSAALVQSTQSVNEEQSNDQQHHGSTGAVAAHVDIAFRQQRQQITAVHSSADLSCETQARAQMLQQATDAILARGRGGDRDDRLILQQRNRLRRTLTVLLSNHLCVSQPGMGLAVGPRVYVHPHVFTMNRQPNGSPSPGGLTGSGSHAQNPEPVENGARRNGDHTQCAPAPQHGANALEAGRQPTESDAPVEDDTSLARRMRRRRLSVSPTESQLSMLLRNIYGQPVASVDPCQNWGQRHEHPARQATHRELVMLPLMHLLVPSQYVRLRGGLALRTGQRLGTTDMSHQESRRVSGDQPAANRFPQLSGTVSAESSGSAAEATIGGEQLLQLPTVRRERNHLVLLQQLLARLQRPQHSTEGPPLPDTNGLISQTVERQASLSSAHCAAGIQTTNPDGCGAQGHGAIPPSFSITRQNEVHAEGREHQILQTERPFTGLSTDQETISPLRPGREEQRDQNMLWGHMPTGYPAQSIVHDNAGNIVERHNQLGPTVTRMSVPTRAAPQYTAGRVQLRFAPSQVVRSSATMPRHEAHTQGRAGPDDRMVLGSAARLSGAINGESAEGRPFFYFVEATGEADNHTKGDSTAAGDDSRDAQKLRVLRGLVVNMHHLIQINIKLQARELRRLPHLREEVQTIAVVLRQNAATLRLIKFTVDMTAVENAAEELVGRNPDARHRGDSAMSLPLLELPCRLPALQVLHIDYPFQVPSGFSASPSFTQLCVRSLHRFVSPFFSNRPSQSTQSSPTLCSHCRPCSASLCDSVMSWRIPRTVPETVSSNGCEPPTQGSPASDSYNCASERQHMTQNEIGGENSAEPCVQRAQARQRAVEGPTEVSILESTSSRKRPREEHTSEGDGYHENEKLPSGHPRFRRRVYLPHSVTPIAEQEHLADCRSQGYCSGLVNTEVQPDPDELAEAHAGLRRKPMLRLRDLDLSPCHTMTPQSDVALSLPTSPASGAREELLAHLREACTPVFASDIPGMNAQTPRVGDFVSAGPASTGEHANDYRKAAFSPSSSNSVFSRGEKLDTTLKSGKGPLVPCCAIIEGNTAAQEESPRQTPLSHLQRLLHFGRDTLQQVDLQGDPPRTFCCLHRRLKFSKLRRLSLGWTCTAELVTLHSMLLKGHLPQLRKLQFSGPSGGSGLSMMHLQLYALLNSPPPTCPHHPPLPLPETIVVSPSIMEGRLTSPLSPPSVASFCASAASKNCGHFGRASSRTLPPVGSSTRHGPHGTFPNIEDEAAIQRFNQQGKFKPHEDCQDVNIGGPCSRNHRDAESSLRETQLRTEQIPPVGAECDINDGIAGEKSSGGEAAGLSGNSHMSHGGQGSFTRPQAAQSIKSGAAPTGNATRELAPLPPLASVTATVDCKRCAAMRGGTAHGVYFKYAALDIDFAALIEFRLALRRHGLFAFYKDERNKLNLLHVEGLTDASSRDALEEEKCLENRLERKNEWKRRFAYHHIQSPPFSFSSSSQAGLSQGYPQSRGSVSAVEIANAALWSAAPLPRNRGIFSSGSAVGFGDVLAAQDGPQDPPPAYHDHSVVPEPGVGRRGTTSYETQSPRVSSAPQIEPRSVLVELRIPTATSAPLAATAASVASDRRRVGGGEGSTAAGAAGVDATVASDDIIPVSSNPSRSPEAHATDSASNSGQARLGLNRIPFAHAETRSGIVAELHLDRCQIQFSPRDTRLRQGQTRSSEPRSEVDLPDCTQPEEPSWRAAENGGPPLPWQRGTHDVANCARLPQREAPEGDAAQTRPLQERRQQARRDTTTSSLTAETFRLSCEAPRCQRDSNGLDRVRSGRVVAREFAAGEGTAHSLNCGEEGAMLPCVELTRGAHCLRSRNDACESTLFTEGGAHLSAEDAASPDSTRAAHTLANLNPYHRINETNGGSNPMSHARQAAPSPHQDGFVAQSHAPPNGEEQPSRQLCALAPSDASVPRRGDEDRLKPATTGRETDCTPKQTRTLTPYFPQVCPSMTGRDLFFLEMWLAPELCRDLQSAPTLFQLFTQLEYLWEHKLNAEQREVYNNVIVKRYVQEREAIPEWNFCTAKAWWMES